MVIWDKKYNEHHCDGCERNCGDCQDAFDEPGGAKRGDGMGFFGSCLVFDPDGVTVWRYAQRRVLDQLAELAKRTDIILA